MEGIPPFQSGRPLLSEITADKLNRILAEIKRNRPVVAAPLSSRVTGDGTYISVKQTAGRGITNRQPWDLIAQPDPESTAENPPYKIRVQPGTLNGILPSNWDTEFTAQPTGLYYAKAVVATDGQAITGVTIEIDTTAPQVLEAELFSIPTTIDYLFGLYKAGQTYRVIGSGHISVSPDVWLTVPKSGAQPGQLPYELYYAVLS